MISQKIHARKRELESKTAESYWVNHSERLECLAQI